MVTHGDSISAFQRLKQEAYHQFKDSLGYIVTSKPHNEWMKRGCLQKANCQSIGAQCRAGTRPWDSMVRCQGPLLLDDSFCVTSVEPSVGMNLLLFCRIFWILCLHVGPGLLQSQPWGLGTAHCSETPTVQVEPPASTPGSFLPFPGHHLTADSSDLLILPLVLAVRQKQAQDERTT